MESESLQQELNAARQAQADAEFCRHIQGCRGCSRVIFREIEDFGGFH